MSQKILNKECSECKGKGEIDVGGWTMFRTCYECEGTGKVPFNKDDIRDQKLEEILKENKIIKRIKKLLHL